jgi:hypothetical protein
MFVLWRFESGQLGVASGDFMRDPIGLLLESFPAD